MSRFDDGTTSESLNNYSDDIERWHLGRLIESKVSLSAPGKPSQVRFARFAYDLESGALVQEVKFARSPYQVTTSYTRDAFGNPIRTVTTTPDGALRSMETRFDPLGRFPVASTNPLGQISTTSYDEVAGVVLIRRNPNGVVVHRTYDTLQREIGQISATGVPTRISFSFPGPGAADFIAFSVVKQTQGLPAARIDYDAAGRSRFERSVGAQGRAVIATHSYDALGRLVRSSVPHFEGTTAFYVEQSFDDLDRITVQKNPDGTRLTNTYVGRLTRSTDALGRTTEAVKDGRGRGLYTIDAAGGRTSLEYDAGGRVVTITNALRQVSRAEYNLAGQRVKLIDPTLGIWKYEFDGYGHLTIQTDPRGNEVKFKYDALGRVTDQTGRESHARWVYDEEKTAVGQVSRVESAGLSKEFHYDEYGRVNGVDLKTGPDHIHVSQSYDVLGRPTFRHYSTGLSVRNSYDQYGFWTQIAVDDREKSVTVWEGQEFDALGRVLKEQLGNGVVSTNSFDLRNGRLNSSRSLSPSAGVVQDYSLQYDLAGNITSRVDAVAGSTEAFKYDKLNRLTSSSAQGTTVALTFDALGNILSKSDTGLYQYCGGPDNHALLCGITRPDGKTTKIAYDTAGNVTETDETRFTIDALGRTERVSESSLNYSAFRYGAEGEMFREETRHGLNKFISLNLGDTQILREEFAPPLFPTPERTRVRHFVQSPGGALGYYEFTFWHFPGRFVEPSYNERSYPIPQRSTELTTGITYFLQDHIGSIRALLDQKGKVRDRLNFDVWGRRTGRHAYRAMNTGYAGHEHLDGLGLIHMGGRIYNPLLARFLSPDPEVQAAAFSQSYNRYSYVLNNPLRMIDPSGFGWLGDFFSGIGNAISGAFNWAVDTFFNKPFKWVAEQLSKAGHWLQENWRTVVVIAVSVALAAVGIPPVFVGALAGGLNAGLYGGSFDDIMKGACIGFISGAYFQVAAAAGGGGLTTALLSGAAGGATSSMQGGNFWSGFAAGFSVSILSPFGRMYPGTGYHVAFAAVAGGIGSSLAGGSFENGAITGSFSALFSEVGESSRSRSLNEEEKRWLKTAIIAEHAADSDFDPKSLEFLDSVKVVNGKFAFFQPDHVAMSPDGNIYWPNAPADAMLNRDNLALLTHEIEHVYDFQQGENIVLKGIWTHLSGWLSQTNPYILDLTAPYRSYNIEQRAESLRYNFFPSYVEVK